MIFYESENLGYNIELIEMVKNIYKVYSTILNNSNEIMKQSRELNKKIEKLISERKYLLKQSDLKKLKKLVFLTFYNNRYISDSNMDELIENELSLKKEEKDPIFSEFIDYILSRSINLFKSNAKLVIIEKEKKLNITKYDKEVLNNVIENSISRVLNEIKKCNTIDEFIDTLNNLYFNSNDYDKELVIIIFDSINKIIDLCIKNINESNLPFKKNKKKIVKFINDFENDRIVDVLDALDILTIYHQKEKILKLNEEAIRFEVAKYNYEVNKKHEEKQKQNIVKSKMKKETREERIERYNRQNSKKEYEDAGDIDLTPEELECLEIYFSVIEELNSNQIEAFENQTSNFLPMLLEGYSKQLIKALQEKIQNSNINPQFQKRICKAVGHLQ